MANKQLKNNGMRGDFPVVGVGASAGGLEAFVHLVSKIPLNTKMAFVLVQHLDPYHSSMSADIISRSTRLKVQEVKDGMKIESGHVYVIPPSYNMEMKGKKLILLRRDTDLARNLNIDIFFRSLAEAKGNRAIGVILSGNGSDGTRGLEAIKSQGGFTCVQEPQSAKFSGMPQYAIAAGVADIILSPEGIAEELIKFAQHPYFLFDSGIDRKANILARSAKGLHHIFLLLKKQTNVDFSNYKPATIGRRIHRRMILQKIKDIDAYAHYLQTNSEEIEALYNDILINVTEFFRDPKAYQSLVRKVLPRLLKGKEHGPMRIWVPGCATGEEVYSIAICFVEYLRTHNLHVPIQIFGTDISDKAIQRARSGFYPESISRFVSAGRLRDFFDKTDGGFKVRKELRDLCLFSKHDMTRDPPFARLDLISCRNVLIYFGSVLQKRVVPLFHYALKPRGFLWLGKSETLGGASKLFTLLDKTHKIYAKEDIRTPMNFYFPKGVPFEMQQNIKDEAMIEKKRLDFKNEVDKILTRFVPPSVVVDNEMEILQFRGKVTSFLEPSVSNNLLKVARPELLSSLRMLIQSVKKKNVPIIKEGVVLEVNDQEFYVDIHALPVNPLAAAKERVYLILFQENVRARSKAKKLDGKVDKKIGDIKNQQITELLEELKESRESQQTLIEQYENAQQELTSANEELQTTNEEFQSTNEELETAKEELQSTNEELVTVNDELQIRNADLTTLSNDLTNLLSSTEIPILMVDSDKRIRRFTPKAEAAFNLIPTDTGRRLSDLRSNFAVDLDGLMSEVSEDFHPRELEVQDREGSWSRLQMRPYKTMDNKIDGAIFTLMDIDLLKQKEKSSKEAYEHMMSVVDAVAVPLVVLENQLNIKSANPAFFQYFQIDHSCLGKELSVALGVKNEHLTLLQDKFNQALLAGVSFIDFQLDCNFSKIGHKNLLLSGGKIHWKGQEPKAMLLSFVDITELRRLEDERNLLLAQERQARRETESANRTKDIFLATLSHELRTPLSSILTWAELISQGAVDSEQAKKGAAVIERSAKIQGQLIDDLLDISRIVAGKISLEMRDVDPAQIVNAAIESVRSVAKEKSIDINVSDQRSCLIQADPIRLQQIIWNLLTNAIKFSPRGSHIKIEIRETQKNGLHQVSIAVSDQGKGISSAFLPYIFSPFRQAESASNRGYGGLGLGLSIAKSLAELQGGTIEVESAGENQGSIFTIRLPTSEVVRESFSAVKVESSSLVPDLKGLRILLVDDDESTRMAIGIGLKNLGALVSTAASAAEALEKFKSFKPDVLLCDISMPGEDGYSLIQKIRKLDGGDRGRVPALAVTAFAGDDDIKRTLKAGFHGHVTKPVGINILGRAILKVRTSRS